MNIVMVIAVSAVIVVAVLCLVAFLWAPKLKQPQLKSADTFAHLVASLITASGILVAGILYLLERQWAPRFDVEVQTNVIPTDATQKVAIIQVDTKIVNESRTTQSIGGYEIGAVGLRPTASSAPDQYGDLPGEAVQTLKRERGKMIRAGETDHAYGELIVPCTWKHVRITVKIPAPPFNINTHRMLEWLTNANQSSRLKGLVWGFERREDGGDQFRDQPPHPFALTMLAHGFPLTP